MNNNLIGLTLAMIISLMLLLLVVAAVFMATLNVSMDYISALFNINNVKINMLQALSLVVVLYILGNLLFKSHEMYVIKTCNDMRKK